MNSALTLVGVHGLGAFGASDDPWLIFDDDIKAEIKTLSAVISVTNSDIQANKEKFSSRYLNAWHVFVEEWLAFKKGYAEGSMFRARSGAWIKVKDFKRRALEWSSVVNKKLNVTTPGLPRPPADPKSFIGSAAMWALVGVTGLVAAGYFVRSFGVASVARAKAEKKHVRS